jgi:penicillin amidase
VVDGEMLGVVGDGGYADGIRARIIRDRLMGIERATPNQMLDVQLDDSARFLDRWRTLALTTLDSRAAGAPDDPQGQRAEFRRLVDTTWTGRASLDSVAYRLVRTFRSHVVRTVMSFVTVPAFRLDPSFDYTRSPRGEGPVWQLVTNRPFHLLESRFNSWDELLLGAIDAAIVELTEDGRPLAARTWGEANRAQIVHPLAAAVPLINRWLNMPPDPLSGDVFAPRAHSPRAGPSERMVVSPGREEEGILHMPTGQSAHPLSPHFADMHQAWVTGAPAPFLPGPVANTLTLVP